MPKTLTTPYFWDCNCETDFIHSKTEKRCSICHAKSHEQPDSRVDEVLPLIDPKTLTKKAFYGSNDRLMAEIQNRNGYLFDGRWFPANGISLDQCLATVNSMTVEELIPFL